MSRKTYRKKKQAASHRPPWLWLAIGSALLLVAAGLAFVWNTDQTDPNFVPEVTGSPRLAVDQITIDEGDVKVNTQIRTVFHLQNVGDQPLHILGEPAVELVEGC